MKKTIIFAGAHPDDETFGVGGTLAMYAAAGADVYYVCGTRGESGTISPDQLNGFQNPGDLRWSELECAAVVLHLAGIFHLGYRDSGMPGAPENKNSDALMAAPLDEAAGRLVGMIRRLKPQVVITHDPVGGYGHPDHVAIHRATVKAFTASGDAGLYPEAGMPFQPQKLYFHIFSRRLLRIATTIMPLLGADPRHFGRNRDIDLAAIARVHFPINARIRLTKEAITIREQARKCHASQVGGGPPPLQLRLLGMTNNLLGENDLFMRGYPTPAGRRKEKDLFEGVV